MGDTLCDHDQRGGTTDVDLPQPPSPDEGHLQIVGGAGHAGNIGNSGETKQRSNSDEDDDPDAEVRSLEEELATLEEAYLVQRRRIESFAEEASVAACDAIAGAAEDQGELLASASHANATIREDSIS